MDSLISLQKCSKSLKICSGVLLAKQLVVKNKHVYFHDDSFWSESGKRFSGLTKIIEKRMGFESGNPYQRYAAVVKRRKCQLAQLHRSCTTYGAKHGSIVHREISSICKSIVKMKSINKKKKRDLCTLRLFHFLNQQQWIPILTEFPVNRPHLNIATAVDLYVIDLKSGELNFLEIKTGHENEFYNPLDSDPLIPFYYYNSSLIKTNMVDCPRHKHDLQVLCSIFLSGVIPDNAYIVRLCSKRKGITCRRISYWETDATIFDRIQKIL